MNEELFKTKQALLTQMGAWAHVGALVGLGVRLGLFSALAGAGSTTAAELAHRTGLNERMLLEWLRCQAAAGVLDYDGDDRFHLSEEASALLSDEDSLAFAGFPLVALPARMKAIDHLVDSFKTGIGFGWDDLGSELVAATERARRTWFRKELIPGALSKMTGVPERLAGGAKVADVGCGAGLALVELASHFPSSEFYGFEVSDLSLRRAEQNRADAGLDNLQFHDAMIQPLPEDHSFDLIMTMDCLHDMPHPERVALSIFNAIKPDGSWFILDFDCEPTFEENLERDPVQAAGSYATSVIICLPSSLSAEGGIGYGTLGLPEPRLGAMVLGAGFRSFRRLGTSGRWALYEANP